MNKKDMVAELQAAILNILHVSGISMWVHYNSCGTHIHVMILKVFGQIGMGKQ